MELNSEQCGSIFEGLTLAALAMGPDSVVLHANPLFLQLTGWALDEVLGKKWLESFVDEADRPTMRERLARIWGGESLPPIVNRIKFKNGSAQLMRWHDSLVRSSAGEPVGIIKIGEDLLDVERALERLQTTEARLGQAEAELDIARLNLGDSEARLDRAQIALDRKDRQLSAIFETAVEAIIIISDRGIMEQANAAAERLFGYSREEIQGRNVSMLMPDPDRSAHDGYIENYLRTGKAKIIGIGREVVGLKKDGSIFPMRLAVSEVRFNSRRYFAGFVEDLTERKRLEREAEEWRLELERRVEARTAELARANRELEHFAHTISHDLRTPLRGIRHYVDFLTEDLSNQLSGESAEDLQRLGRAADELERMIQDLLDYTRIGRRQSAPEEFLLADLLESIARVLGKMPDTEIVISPDLPRMIAPSGTVRQIFQNLIENGLTYNQSKPKRIEITGKLIKPGENPRWRIAVRDNGIGVDPQHHEKIFMMFQRLHTDEEFPGTGIGLAAVRKAAEHLGGSVSLESEPGKGSIFYVDLPQRTE